MPLGHRSQPWFDITSYDVGQMRGLLMSSTVRVGVCANATLDQKPADAMLEKCVAMLPEGAAFLSYGTLSRGPGLLESLAKSVAGATVENTQPTCSAVGSARWPSLSLADAADPRGGVVLHYTKVPRAGAARARRAPSAATAHAASSASAARAEPARLRVSSPR